MSISEIDINRALNTFQILKPDGTYDPEHEPKLTANELRRLLKKYPIFNASLDEEKGEIILKKYYNIGIATATPEGLVVPVIKDADKKSITEIAKEIEILAEKARTGKLELSDVRDGTFSITNIGSIGGILSVPIINYPEVAILGVHKILEKPMVKDNQIVIRKIVYLSLSFDLELLMARW